MRAEATRTLTAAESISKRLDHTTETITIVNLVTTAPTTMHSKTRMGEGSKIPMEGSRILMQGSMPMPSRTPMEDRRTNTGGMTLLHTNSTIGIDRMTLLPTDSTTRMGKKIPLPTDITTRIGKRTLTGSRMLTDRTIPRTHSATLTGSMMCTMAKGVTITIHLSTAEVRTTEVLTTTIATTSTAASTTTIRVRRIMAVGATGAAITAVGAAEMLLVVSTMPTTTGLASLADIATLRGIGLANSVVLRNLTPRTDSTTRMAVVVGVGDTLIREDIPTNKEEGDAGTPNKEEAIPQTRGKEDTPSGEGIPTSPDTLVPFVSETATHKTPKTTTGVFYICFHYTYYKKNLLAKNLLVVTQLSCYSRQ